MAYFDLISVAPGTPTGDYLQARGVWLQIWELLKQREDLVPFRQVVPLNMETKVRQIAKLGRKKLLFFQHLVQSSTGIDLRRWFNVPGCKTEEALASNDCVWNYFLTLGLARFQPKTKEIKATKNAFHPQIQFLTGLTTKYEM